MTVEAAGSKKIVIHCFDRKWQLFTWWVFFSLWRLLFCLWFSNSLPHHSDSNKTQPVVFFSLKPRRKQGLHSLQWGKRKDLIHHVSTCWHSFVYSSRCWHLSSFFFIILHRSSIWQLDGLCKMGFDLIPQLLMSFWRFFQTKTFVFLRQPYWSYCSRVQL